MAHLAKTSSQSLSGTYKGCGWHKTKSVEYKISCNTYPFFLVALVAIDVIPQPIGVLFLKIRIGNHEEYKVYIKLSLYLGVLLAPLEECSEMYCLTRSIVVVYRQQL